MDHRPSTIDHQPSTIDHRPSTIDLRPSTINHQPSTNDHRPLTIAHQPSAIHHRPSTIDYRPSTIDYRPLTIDHRPSTIDHRPLTISRYNEGAFIVTDNRVFDGPLGHSLSLCARSLAPLRGALLRSLTLFIGRLTHFAHSLIGRLFSHRTPINYGRLPPSIP